MMKNVHQACCVSSRQLASCRIYPGAGRMDRLHTQHIPVKDIYVFPLTRHPHHILCALPQSGTPFIRRAPIRDGQDRPRDWTEDEVGGADLEDCRLTKRLVTILQDRYARPQASIPRTCQTRAKTKAAYRFFAHPETTMEKILAPHYQTTLKRITGESVVLAVQDTTASIIPRIRQPRISAPSVTRRIIFSACGSMTPWPSPLRASR